MLFRSNGMPALETLAERRGEPRAMAAEQVDLLGTPKERPASVTFRGDQGYASNESVAASLRVIQEDDDIAFEYPARVGGIMLQGIQRVAEGKQGRATDVLKSIVNWADANNKPLVLMPAGEISCDRGALVSWYNRHGFVTQSDGAMVQIGRAHV